jgi:hypothetical protein
VQVCTLFNPYVGSCHPLTGGDSSGPERSRAVPSGPERSRARSRAVPSGPERSRAVPSGPERPLAPTIVTYGAACPPLPLLRPA